MSTSGAIRAGAAYVELTADDSPMIARLRASQERLRQWVRDNQAMVEAPAAGAEGGTFLGGTFRGAEIAGTALKVGTAIAAVKVAIKDVQGISALFRGDMEGARKAAAEMPFGLGQIVQELQPVVDDVVRKLVFAFKGIEDAGRTGVDSAWLKEATESVERYNRGLKAVEAAQKALEKVTLSPWQQAVRDVKAQNLRPEDEERVLTLTAQRMLAEERIASERRQQAEAEAAQKRGADAYNQALRERARLSMTDEEWVAEEVRLLGVDERLARGILDLRLEALKITKEHAASEKRRQADESFAGTLAGVRDRIREATGEFDALGLEERRVRDDLGRLFDQSILAATDYMQKIDQVRAAFKELRAAQEAAEAKREAQGVAESVKTPEERLKDEAARLKKMREAGLITADTYGRAMDKALKDAAAGMAATVRQTVAVRGMFSTAAADRLGLASATAEDRTARATEETVRLLKKMLVEAGLGDGLVFAP
jgi:hypothetical protein